MVTPLPADPSAEPDDFAVMARPLLELTARLTGMQATFITSIDWEAQSQEVLTTYAVGPPMMTAGGVVRWPDSMCRRIFLSGSPATADVPGDFPDSPGARHGMVTFFALPIADGDRTLGTLCGTSAQRVELSEDTLGSVGLVAEALAVLLRTEQGRRRAEAAAAELRGALGATAVEGTALAEEVARLRRLATTDELTGLLNRRGFLAAWEQRLADAGRTGRPLGLLMVDLDHFKAINDTFGHSTGDAVLRATADALRRACRATDLLARIGGDELAVGLVGGTADACEATAARIAAELRETTSGLGLPSTVTVSVGSAWTGPVDLDGLMEAADRSLYAHKRRRR